MSTGTGKVLVAVAARYAGIVVQLGIVMLVARRMGTGDAGAYFVMVGLVQSLYLAVGAGMPEGLVRGAAAAVAQGSSSEVRRMVAACVRVAAASSVLVAAVAAGVLIAQGQDSEVVVAGAVWLTALGVTYVAAQIVVAVGEPALGAFLNYSAVSAVLGLSVVPLLLATTPDLALLVRVTAAGATAAACGAALLARRAVGRLPVAPRCGSAPVGRIWRDGAAMSLGRFVQSVVVWMPVWVAGALLGEGAAATVAVAGRLLGGVGAATAAFKFTARPAIARDAALGRWDHVRAHGSRAALWTSAVTVSALLLVALLGAPIALSVLGEQYSRVPAVLIILLLGLLAENTMGTVDEVLKMSGGAPIVVLCQTAGLLVGVAIAVGGARQGSVHGVALGFAATQVVSYALQAAALHRRSGVVVVPRLPRRRAVVV